MTAQKNDRATFFPLETTLCFFFFTFLTKSLCERLSTRLQQARDCMNKSDYMIKFFFPPILTTGLMNFHACLLSPEKRKWATFFPLPLP